MSMFNINLDSDMDYLIKEVGKDIKINNITASAIINNVDNQEDDKELITKSEILRGDYIEHNNLYFLIMDNVNDKRYNVYNKATIRSCNHDIKFIIGDRLFLYYAIIEGDKFYIQNDSIISMSADTITVTLPKTSITKQLKEQDCFLKWGQKWEVQGINNTKDGLIILNCKTIGTSHLDDKENEIADRWIEENGIKTDRLNGNITPIYPFTDVPPVEPEEPVENLDIINFQTFEDIEVNVGTTVENITLPTVITVTLKDSTTKQLMVTWDTSTYNADIAGTYTFTGTIKGIKGIITTINVIVADASTEPKLTYTITAQMPYPDIPDNEIWLDDPPAIYTVHKFVDGVETSGKFTFEVTDTSVVTITETTDNTASIIANDFVGKKNIKLIATDTDTGQVAIEKEILICGR